MKKYAIIVAGGKGVRMGADVPKQFLPIGGKPVLMRTLETFNKYDEALELILVLPVAQQAYWRDLCHTYSFSIPHTIANGGETRFHSVKNGLECINSEKEALVAVHDGVRPFVAQEVISECFSVAFEKEAVIPVMDVVETVRQVADESSKTVDRNLYKLVQTPQVFHLQLLKKAYSQPYTPLFTDDASVVEALGKEVFLVKGNRENIKITTPFDIKVANALL